MFLQLLIGGVAMGLIYALIAIEYTLIYNSCALLNFAHGQLVMFGAYIFAGTMVTSLGMSFAQAGLELSFYPELLVLR